MLLLRRSVPRRLKASMASKGLDYNHDELYPNHKCLSSSQVIGYLESPSKFWEEYVVGMKRSESEAMFIGKIFSAMYADRKFKWKEAMSGKVTNARIYRALETAIKAFPEIPKKCCEYALKCKYRGWTFRATLDGYWDNRIDIENKTGQREWNQDRADESMQVTFQYWVKWIKDGVLFDECQLNWVDLRASAPQLVQTFITHRSIEDVQKFQELIDYVIDGVEAEDWS